MRFGGSTQGPNWAVFFASLAAGRGGHLGGPATKWGGRERLVGHAAVPPAVRRWPLPLAGPRGPFLSRGVPSEISGWIEPAGSAGLGLAKNKKEAPLEDELQHRIS
jgi:hypothetical protein